MSTVTPLSKGRVTNSGNLLTSGHSYVGVNTSNDVTITLSEIDFDAGAGPITIKDDLGNAAVKPITIATEEGVTIDGVDELQITQNFGSITVLPVTEAGSAGWRVIQKTESLTLIATLTRTVTQSIPVGLTVIPIDITDAVVDNDFFASVNGTSLTQIFFKQNKHYVIIGQGNMTRGNNSAGSLKGGLGIFYSEQSPIFIQTAPCQFNAGDPVDTLQVAHFNTELVVNNASPSNILAIDAFQTTNATAANTLTLPRITYPAVSGGNNGSIELSIYVR